MRCFTNRTAVATTRWGLPLVVCLGLSALVAGCGKQAEQQAAAPAPSDDAKSPEQQSFDQIVTYMRHMLVEPDPTRPAGIQRFPAGTRNTTSGSEGVLTYELKLDSSPEIIPPKNPEEPYRGVIEVTMTTSYSHIQKRGDEEEEPEKKRERPGEVKGETIDQIISDPDLQIDQLDADRILAETGGSRDPAKAPPRTTVLEPKEEKVVFELEYIDGKWQLANDDVETSLTSARRTLETALARQR